VADKVDRLRRLFAARIDLLTDRGENALRGRIEGIVADSNHVETGCLDPRCQQPHGGFCAAQTMEENDRFPVGGVTRL
jgi:hypothetical protein